MKYENEIPWRRLYGQALGNSQPISGTYHDNFVVAHDGRRYVLRVDRIFDEPDVEPRMYREASVLSALGNADVASPELIYASTKPRFIVTSYRPGTRVADLYPPGTGLPASFITFVRETMVKLYQVEEASLGATHVANPWVSPPKGVAFATGLLGWLTKIYESASDDVKGFLEFVGVPRDPFNIQHFALEAERRHRLCHGDLQRENVLTASTEGYSLLDWEMAVWGDPVWDIASHIHRTAYPVEQEYLAAQELLDACPDWRGSNGDFHDYEAYLKIERYRSLVLDCIRNLRLGGGWTPETRVREAATYHRKLVTAGIKKLSRADIIEHFARHWVFNDYPKSC